MALAYKSAWPFRSACTHDPAFVRVLAHLAPAPRASLLAILVGFIAVGVQAPLALVPPLVIVTILIGVPMGLFLSLPVTFIALPLSALACGKYPTGRMIVLPLVGLVAGASVTHLTFLGSPPSDWQGLKMFIVAGSIAGLAAGFYFVRKTRQLYDVYLTEQP